VNDERDDAAIARALHADDGTGAVDADRVAAFAEVLGRLPFDEVPPPPGLEDRVVAAALARRPAAAVARQARPRARRHHARLGALAAAAAVAAAVVGVMTATRDSPPLPPRGVIEGASTADAVAAIARVPGARTGTFGPAGGTAALAPDGTGAIAAAVPADPVTVVLETAGDAVTLGTTSLRGRTLRLRVEHPELVRAVVLRDEGGREVARAVLSPG
jgi:hypothetical protein